MATHTLTNNIVLSFLGKDHHTSVIAMVTVVHKLAIIVQIIQSPKKNQFPYVVFIANSYTGRQQHLALQETFYYFLYAWKFHLSSSSVINH